MKSPADIKPSSNARAQRAALIHKQLSRNSETQHPEPRLLSPLESLPTEVFEQIFFHCLEPNLPRASLHLARAISRPAIFSALVLLAYCETDLLLEHLGREQSRLDPHKSSPKDERLVLLERILESQGSTLDRLSLQQHISLCRWFTVGQLESCIPVLSRIHMVHRWYEEKKLLEDRIAQKKKQNSTRPTLNNPDSSTRVLGRNLSMKLQALPDLDDLAGMEAHFHAKLEHMPSQDRRGYNFQPAAHEKVGPTDRDGYLPFISTLSLLAAPDFNFFQLERSERSVLSVCVLPDGLLRGAPWTDSKVTLLQWLRQALRYQDWPRNLVMSREALYAGMFSAINEGHEKALLVLLELHDGLAKYESPVADGCLVFLPEKAHPLPLRLFHLACETISSNPSESQKRMLAMLIRSGMESVPSEDVTLTRWALQVRAQASSSEEEAWAAEQLLWGMQYLSTAMHPHEILNFGDAAASLVKRPVSTMVSFTDEIGYICPAGVVSTGLTVIDPSMAVHANDGHV
jgi:hypothetical protein